MAFPTGNAGASSYKEAPADPSSDSKWLVDHFIMQMVWAEANNNVYHLFVFCKFVLYRLMAYMPQETKLTLNDEFKKFFETEYKIKSSNDPEETKKMQLNDLRMSFVKAHEGLIYLTLPKAGFLNLEEEGIIDFKKHDFDVFKGLVKRYKQVSEIEKEKLEVDEELAEKADPKEKLDKNIDELDKTTGEGKE
jgi:hypothetical protein